MFPEFFIIINDIKASKKFWLSTVVRKYFSAIAKWGVRKSLIFLNNFYILEFIKIFDDLLSSNAWNMGAY